MKNAFLMGLSMAAVAAAVPVHAGSMGPVSTGSEYPSGFVIGGDIGYGYLSTQEGYLVPPKIYVNETILNTKSIGHFVWGAHAGYDAPILERFLAGVEVGYKDLGKSHYSTYFHDAVSRGFYEPNIVQNSIQVSQQAIDFLITSRLYLSKGLNVFGKAGAAYVRSKSTDQYSLTFDTTPVDPRDVAGQYSERSVIWRIRPELDVGVGYSFSKNLDLHVMYTYINGTDGNTDGWRKFYPIVDKGTDPGTFSFNGLTAGLSYYFG